MRSIWNGAITFGLISIPVRLFTAVEEKSLKFHQLHAPDNGRIRYRRVCSVDNEEVPFDEIVKGYEYEKDRYVVFTDEELERLPSDSIRAVDVVSFVPLEEIDRSVEVRPQELAMAKSLIDNLTEHFDPSQFVDTYRKRLEEAAEAKIAGQEVAVAPSAEPTQILDLMEALKASVEATKAKKDAALQEAAQASG